MPSTVTPTKNFGLNLEGRVAEAHASEYCGVETPVRSSEDETSIVMISATYRTPPNVEYNSIYVKLIPEGERSWEMPIETHYLVEFIGYSHECFPFPTQSYLCLEHGKVRNKSLRRG